MKEGEVYIYNCYNLNEIPETLNEEIDLDEITHNLLCTNTDISIKEVMSFSHEDILTNIDI